MPNKIASFFKSYDSLGPSINFNYRGEEKFGTCMGGCASIIANTLIFVIIGSQLCGWFFSAKWNQDIGFSYLTYQNPVEYNIPIRDFLPTVLVYAPKADMKITRDSTPNDPRFWDIHFEQWVTGEDD